MSNIEQAILAGITQAITSVSRDLVSATANLAKSGGEKLLAEFEIGFGKYTARNLERCSKVKTLIHRYEPIDIALAYLPQTLAFSKRNIDQGALIQSLPDLRRAVITGIAGCGKSMFLKYLFVTLCKSPLAGRIPIFIEMRHLNNVPEKTLSQYIHSQIAAIVKRFTEEQLEYCLARGKLILMLDGIDEIEYSIRDKFCDQILDIAYRHPQTIIVASSRPQDRFVSWNEFHVGQIMPLSKDQVIELINSLEYDEAVKQKFLKEVDSPKYEKHQEFLSNPLLCTMMLMTFDEFAEIPSKMHVFYDQAFNVLYSKHDAMKASFRRKFYTTLSIDDFKRLLSTFCLLSYMDSKVTFTESEAREYARKAASYEAINVSQDMYVNDLQESVCFLLRDGDSLVFLHRSFQEYFVALFLAQRQTEHVGKLIELIMRRHFYDEALDMLVDMNREVFETKFFRHQLKVFCDVVKTLDVKRDPKAMFGLFYDTLFLDLDDDENEIAFGHSGREALQQTFSLIYRYYRDDRFPSWTFPNLDLASLIEKHGLSEELPQIQVPYDELTNDLLFDVGFANYLLFIKEVAFRILEEIDSRAKQRNDVISRMLESKHKAR